MEAFILPAFPSVSYLWPRSARTPPLQLYNYGKGVRAYCKEARRMDPRFNFGGLNDLAFDPHEPQNSSSPESRPIFN